MLLQRFTIVCLMIAGFAAFARILTYRTYDIYGDQPVVDAVALAHMHDLADGKTRQ
ncbi:hypothetical protein P053_02322 [Brucella abortus 01-4165]|uniref:hypothetical protein n=1 Tax=Brucella abortus TaxID=235 RepID=UPI0002CF31BA|nr:hypothetical protein [Brucella abortus]ENR98751.1 hypothetical protein B971_00940 [Brucella abortus 84/26]EPG04994.1 hypothetical protein L265_01527 [Brucella abortus 90-0775]EPG32631.1 hypothetical protein L253_01484 [Brucella abortus 68-3396P]ERT73363.1 hypothetical protein P053_02322 [Brucella abortus 01-4165]EPG19150.1 hypothetical protein L257_00629 [Brucella abortus 82-3893]